MSLRRLIGSAEVYGQPDRRLVLGRPRHPMGPVTGDQDMVARTKIALTFALNAETCRAGKEQDPFVVFLTMGFIRGRRLTSRNDPLDTHVLPREHFGEYLPISASREVIEKIDHEPCSNLRHGGSDRVMPGSTRSHSYRSYPNTSCSTPPRTTTVLSTVIVVRMTGMSKCPAV
jgi:hypothetical protein